MLKGHEGQRILELGCGNGYFSNILSGLGHKVIGIDNSKSWIEIAKSNFPEITFIESDIYDLETRPEISGKHFDAVVALEVIEHLQYPKKMIRIAKTYLKDGGKLIMSAPFHGYLKNLAISLLNGWDRHIDVFSDCGHLRFFSVNTMKKMLEEDGFNNIRFKFVGRFPLLWKSMVSVCVK